MIIESLGFVEVRGAANAIAVADAMIKTSAVRILTEQGLDPGQVTVVVEGDLGACQAAIEVGAEVARRHDCLVSVLLKGKPDPAIERLFRDAVVAPPPSRPGPHSSGQTPAASSPVPSTPATDARPRRVPADVAGTAPADQAQNPRHEAEDATSAAMTAPEEAAALPSTGEPGAAPSFGDAVDPQDDAIVAFVAAAEKGRTVAEIAQVFGIGVRAARTRVGRLIDAERLERFNRGIRAVQRPDTDTSEP